MFYLLIASPPPACHPYVDERYCMSTECRAVHESNISRFPCNLHNLTKLLFTILDDRARGIASANCVFAQNGLGGCPPLLFIGFLDELLSVSIPAVIERRVMRNKFASGAPGDLTYCQYVRFDKRRIIFWPIASVTRAIYSSLNMNS